VLNSVNILLKVRERNKIRPCFTIFIDLTLNAIFKRVLKIRLNLSFWEEKNVSHI